VRIKELLGFVLLRVIVVLVSALAGSEPVPGVLMPVHGSGVYSLFLSCVV